MMEKGTTISHYTILDKLGEGGMGVVYKAHDNRLDRTVALKFLPPHISRSEIEKKRFLHEARAASALDHPNICTIHEIGESPGGELFIVMPAYEGKTLDKLIESGTVEPDKAVRIIIQVMEGLKAAHQKEITHRDIKSSNIFLTDQNQVKIMDFGLAHRSGASRITQQDSTIGTVLYMSPEQAKGDEIDRRTDIWSLGMVLYELLSGSLPFKADYDQAVIYRILNEVHKPLTDQNPSIPVELSEIVDKCLQKNRDNRYQSIDEAIADLRTLISSGEETASFSAASSGIHILKKPVVLVPSFITIGLIAVSLFLLLGSSPVLPFEERDWVLITEFDNQTGEEIFDRSLNTALNASLGQSMHINIFPDVRIPDALKRMGRSEDEKIDEQMGIEISFREGISGLIVPQISKVGERYSITVRLIDPVSAVTVRSYVETAQNQDNILPALDNIIRNIRRDLGESLFSVRTSEREILKVTTPSLQALKYYSDGVYHWGNGNYDEATELHHLALEHDPEFASAHAALGIHYSSFIYNEIERGKEHFEKAIQFSDRASERERLFIRASYQNSLNRINEAEQLYRLYLDSYPDDWRVHFNLARLYMTSSRPGKAVSAFEEVLRMVPNDAGTLINLATSHSMNRNYPEALQYYNRAFDIQPDYYSSPNVVHEYGIAYVRNGARLDARAIYNQMLDTGIRARGLRSLALLDMYEGKFRSAKPKLEDAILSHHANVEPLSEAIVRLFYSLLLYETGELDAMKIELETAHQLLEETGPQTWLLQHLSKLHARLEEIDKASIILRELSTYIDSDIPSERSLLLSSEGEIELAKGNYSEAINKFMLSYRTHENTGAEYGLAYTHYLAGNYEESISFFNSFLETSKFGFVYQHDWLWAHYYCARAYMLLEQHEEAEEVLDQFFDIWSEADPNSELLTMATRLRDSL